MEIGEHKEHMETGEDMDHGKEPTKTQKRQTLLYKYQNKTVKHIFIIVVHRMQ